MTSEIIKKIRPIIRKKVPPVKAFNKRNVPVNKNPMMTCGFSLMKRVSLMEVIIDFILL
jgi:hypothetical protein